MTAEESLSVVVRSHLSGAGAMSEVKMFGGTGFMLNGNMVAAVSPPTDSHVLRSRRLDRAFPQWPLNRLRLACRLVPRDTSPKGIVMSGRAPANQGLFSALRWS